MLRLPGGFYIKMRIFLALFVTKERKKVAVFC